MMALIACVEGCAPRAPATPGTGSAESHFDRIVYGPVAGLKPSPWYTIVVDPNGAAKLYGCEVTPFEGIFAGRVAAAHIAKLSRLLATHNYYRNTKSVLAPDASGVTFGILVNGERIERLTSSPVPDDLHELGKIMDGIVLTTQWRGKAADPPYSTLDDRLRRHGLRFFQQLIGCGIPNSSDPLGAMSIRTPVYAIVVGGNMNLEISNLLRDFERQKGATDEGISAGESQLGVSLPAEYVDFLKLTNGGEGFIGGGYAQLWPIEELYSQNQKYQIREFIPGLLVFGSNGGGEAFGFDTRAQDWQIVQVPWIGEGWKDAQPLGPTFDQFLKHLFEMK